MITTYFHSSVLSHRVENAELLSFITEHINSCQKLSSQTQIHVGKTPPDMARCAKFENLPAPKKTLFYVHVNNVVMNFTEFYKYLKFMNFIEF